jgi:hypothetical protein
MKQKFLLSLVLGATLLFAGCSSKLEEKEQVTINSGKVSQGIEIGKKLEEYNLTDQFNKQHHLTNSTKKVIFVFTKPTGHLVKSYLLTKDKNYLSDRKIDFIADVSGMPSIIFSMFALPDFKKSNYTVLLIKDKKKSKIFRDDKHKEEVMIITLDNKIVKDVKFISAKKDLIKAID